MIIRTKKKHDLTNDYKLEKWGTSVSTQIAHYSQIKGSSKRPESF